jgi:hypothetical protein
MNHVWMSLLSTVCHKTAIGILIIETTTGTQSSHKNHVIENVSTPRLASSVHLTFSFFNAILETCLLRSKVESVMTRVALVNQRHTKTPDQHNVS